MAGKEAVVLIVDVNPAMGVPRADGSSGLDLAKRAVSLMLQQKLIFPRQDELGIVLAGSAQTFNDLHAAEPSHYQHVQVKQPITVRPQISTHSSACCRLCLAPPSSHPLTLARSRPPSVALLPVATEARHLLPLHDRRNRLRGLRRRRYTLTLPPPTPSLPTLSLPLPPLSHIHPLSPPHLSSPHLPPPLPVIDALLVAMDLLHKRVGRLKFTKRIFLFTNAASPIEWTAPDLVGTYEGIVASGYRINVVGIDFQDVVPSSTTGDGDDDDDIPIFRHSSAVDRRSAQQKANEALLRDMAEAVDGAVIGINSAMRVMSTLKKRVNQVTKYRGPLEVGGVKVQVATYTKTQPLPLPSMKREVVSERYADDGRGRGEGEADGENGEGGGEEGGGGDEGTSMAGEDGEERKVVQSRTYWDKTAVCLPTSPHSLCLPLHSSHADPGSPPLCPLLSCRSACCVCCGV